jgi:hypothetical protein
MVPCAQEHPPQAQMHLQTCCKHPHAYFQPLHPFLSLPTNIHTVTPQIYDDIHKLMETRCIWAPYKGSKICFIFPSPAMLGGCYGAAFAGRV